MIVLGGEPKVRTRQAAKLFLEKRAPLILLSGNGDCETNKGELLQDGIPETAILLECESLSTKENAEFSVRILRERKAKQVILVTSWYHSRRALQTFREAAPEIEFISLPAPRVKLQWKYERDHIFNEYLGIIYYAVRWGVSPI